MLCAHVRRSEFPEELRLAKVEIEGGNIYHKTEYHERRNHYAFFSVNASFAGSDTDMDTFRSRFNGFNVPVRFSVSAGVGGIAAVKATF